MVSIDSTFKIECCFLIEQVGESGERRLQDLVLNTLPSEYAQTTIKASVAQITTLKATDIYKTTSQSSQTGVAATLDILTSMLQGASSYPSPRARELLVEGRCESPVLRARGA